MDVSPRTRDSDFANRPLSNDSQTADSISDLIHLLVGFVRRQYQVFIIVPACALAIGTAYLIVTPPQYTATATLVIDASKMRVLQNQQQPVGDTPLDTTQVETQVEVLKSAKLALAVIKELNLIEDPEFVGGEGYLAALRGLLFSRDSSNAQSEAMKMRRALRILVGQRSIARVGKTYVLDISYTSLSPTRAAEVANAIADAYILDQLDAKYQATRRASAWLQERIDDLKTQAMAADQAVLDYREKNNIVDVGGSLNATGPGNAGRPIGEQQLAELSTQLVNARAATSDAKARLDRIEEVLKLDVREAAVSDTLKNEVITRLRNQYLDLAAREANWSARFGRDHLAAVNLRTQLEELRRSIADEVGRIAATYRSDYEIAKARQEKFERALTNLVSEGQLTNRDRLGLVELESRAKVYRTIYDNFLQRNTEAIQQQSFPITEARVITSATPPAGKSKPVSSMVLAIATSLGLILSVGVAALREAIDRGFRTGHQAENALAVSCLSVIPLVRNGAPSKAMAPPATGRRTIFPWGANANEIIGARSESVEAQGKAFSLIDPSMWRVVNEPLSAFTESFRAIKVAAENRSAIRENKVIGITSTLPNEGKSTVACNLAELMADAGKRVILVDADLRKPTLVRSLIPKPTAGLIEFLTGEAEFQNMVGVDPKTGLTFLPTLPDKRLIHSDEVLASSAFKNLIDQLRQRYDYIIIDLPPIVPLVDARAAAPVIDSVVFVVEWGSTKIEIVQRRLVSMPEIYDRLLGVVLNKVNFKILARFEQQGRYDSQYYVKYGYKV
jgi:succinoglycan biosynthesis transport protein ExoP